VSEDLARPASRSRHRLAEGPVWDDARQRLYWVDIPAGRVLAGTFIDGHIDVVEQWDFPRTVGAVLPRADGTLVVAAHDRLISIAPNGSRTEGAVLVDDPDRRRLNDAILDPAGRVLAGTLSLDGVSQSEQLMRVEHDGSVTCLDRDLTLSNGLAFSVDGRTLFSVDTLRHTVFARDYDAATGDVGERRVHLQLAGAMPDGLTVDPDDHLWIALWGAGQVRRYDPNGALVGSVSVPAPHTSSVALAGADLSTLVITTATEDLSEDELRAFPESGRLFTVDVRG
jgi:sugar lactone lactonase YvrE